MKIVHFVYKEKAREVCVTLETKTSLYGFDLTYLDKAQQEYLRKNCKYLVPHLNAVTNEMRIYQINDETYKVLSSSEIDDKRKKQILDCVLSNKTLIWDKYDTYKKSYRNFSQSKIIYDKSSEADITKE